MLRKKEPKLGDRCSGKAGRLCAYSELLYAISSKLINAAKLLGLPIFVVRANLKIGHNVPALREGLGFGQNRYQKLFLLLRVANRLLLIGSKSLSDPCVTLRYEAQCVTQTGAGTLLDSGIIW